jgi:excisionase family DNA binding protein
MEFPPTTVPETGAPAKTAFERLCEQAREQANAAVAQMARIAERNLSYSPEVKARIAAVMEHVDEPAPAPPDGLKTQAQAARRLNVSIRTLRGLVDSGELRYVNIGRGKRREKMMFTDGDLDDLIARRTRQKAQETCPSTSPKARRSTTSTSSGAVLAFTARRNGQTGGKRKP